MSGGGSNLIWLHGKNSLLLFWFLGRPAVSVLAGVRRSRLVLTAFAVGLIVAVLVSWNIAPARAAALPSPDHVVVVVFENHSYSQIIGSSSAPYINNTLKSGGANLTASYGLTHPSQPNYLALFSGGTQGITNDNCYTPGFSSAANLGSELIAAGRTWGSYNEGLPAEGSTVCTNSSTKYARKHNPWFAFSNVPLNTAHTFAQFPSNYSTLPKVSFVIPNLCNDMHDCSVSTGDTWLKSNLSAYATWAQTHNSLLIVTFDEDNGSSGNHITTVLYGAHVTPGSSSSTTYNHYNVLRTLEDLSGLTTHAGNAGSASDITGIWS
ncbi:phosphatidylinositol-3-phosphate phosphatase [Frankia casuarinae]|uniref:Phosphatidylinositol-3-phosphate phosphatase n=1 Tax=Frankia casuarinae (strain DSM 45818 / CECT 9043 / HFP020203 / CcI3) TaxID=106370 RepID=Q2JF19_FRACC|nr:phosphatidylinositol-3-phosphate phosphatase [Frankia casuarinae]